jgi:hypothetical protein
VYAAAAGMGLSPGVSRAGGLCHAHALDAGGTTLHATRDVHCTPTGLSLEISNSVRPDVGTVSTTAVQSRAGVRLRRPTMDGAVAMGVALARG